MKMGKIYICQGCRGDKTSREMVPSFTAKSGYLRFCRECHGKQSKKGRTYAKKASHTVAAANAALQAANADKSFSEPLQVSIRFFLQKIEREMDIKITSVDIDGDNCSVTYNVTKRFSL